VTGLFFCFCFVCLFIIYWIGAFIERAGGDVWSESNEDGGDWLFDWGVVRSEIYLLCITVDKKTTNIV
jgi:hypothetical protein